MSGDQDPAIAQISISAGQCCLAEKQKTWDRGDCSVGTLRGPASWGAASDFEDLIRDHNRGVNELHFHIRLCCVIRILI